jgi:hypothetical protein
MQRTASAAPLAVFRILLGTMLLLSIGRFYLKGWIDELYVKPLYHFSFYGFEFIKPLGDYTYWLFLICALAALFFAVGLFYRIASIVLFLSFTYIELMDKTTYLNHYYFISLICFLMMFLPAHTYFSIDAFRNKNLLADRIPRWNIDAIKVMVCILYFFAGLAKINTDWLLHALPLKIWLPARNDMPIMGSLFNYAWVHFAFSWIGCIYDLSIPFLLWNRKTRTYAYAAVVIFHVLTAMLFPIGMFPYVMIVTALIFFSSDFHIKIIERFGKCLNLGSNFLFPNRDYEWSKKTANITTFVFVVFFVFQFAMPLRYLLYKNNLFWTEEGYRFSWRVMLMEKAGSAEFVVKDRSGKQRIVNNDLFLTTLQEKMMATQPDMILEYAHLLRNYYANQGFENPEVYVESYVTLNGRLSKQFIDPTINLSLVEESFARKSWIINYNE